MIFTDILINGLKAFALNNTSDYLVYDINTSGWFALLAVFLSIFFTFEAIMFFCKMFPTDDSYPFVLTNVLNFLISLLITLVGLKALAYFFIVVLIISIIVLTKIGIWKLYKIYVGK